jgi:hypothetical protein
MRPLRFVRELYCLDSKLRPLGGAAAERRGCPASFDAAAFVAAHPALFYASGWAHHPYAFTTGPREADKNPDNTTLSGVPRLTRTLDRAARVYGQSTRFPVWLTEYGYQTDPPDPTIGVSFARQAAWLDDATYIAFGNKRIATFAQFLAGRPISVMRRGRGLRVFGQLRTAGGRGAHVQLLTRGARSWRKVATATGDARGFVLVTLRRARAGRYRIAWAGDGASRAVTVRP